MKQEELWKLLGEMTLEEKAGQLIQLDGRLILGRGDRQTGPETENRPDLLPGSVLNFDSAEMARELQSRHLSEDRLKIPLLLMLDVIHGHRTTYPIPLAMGCSFDEGLMEECGKMAAREAAACGVHVTFAPMMDTARDPRWGRIMETCSEDPLVNGRMGAALVRGMQGEDLRAGDRVACCVKHFAAYGAGEAGRDYNRVDLPENTLREQYLPAYRACLEAGARMVMTSFNTLNGVPAVASTFLRRVLREEWGFDGVIISDYNAIGELMNHGVAEDEDDCACLAMGAECDVDMMSLVYARLPDLVRSGKIPEAALDAAVMRVLRLKQELGLFENPWHGADPETEKRVYLCEAHRETARRAAEESAVLLKNEGILPLPGNPGKVALIGPFATDAHLNGAWSRPGAEEDTVTLPEGIRQVMPGVELRTARGCSAEWNVDPSGIAEAVELARQSDWVILTLGEAEWLSGEGRSRTELSFPGAQMQLFREILAVNPRTVVVLFHGRPLVLTEISRTAPAILDMWFPGQQAGPAMARLLWGHANPCGKLSVSLPWTLGQVPLSHNRLNTGRPKPQPDTGVFPFTSSYLDAPNLPLYSFGNGLSYTEFVYESLETDREVFSDTEGLTVRIRVRNAGERPGKEVVQLYVRDLVARVARPVQQILDYRKILLQPGETQEVVFRVEEKQLRFWDAEGNFLSESGDFEFSTGWADHLLHTKRVQMTKREAV